MQDRGTQTCESRYGAELRIHFIGLSTRLTILAILSEILCILNGCSYYLCWRPAFLPINNNNNNNNFLPPVAFYASAVGVFFQFIITQLLVQLILRTLINQISFRQREKYIKQYYITFAILLLPSTSSQLSLYAQGIYDASRPHAVIFIITISLNIFCGICALSYAWNSTCVDYIQNKVRRAAWERKIKMRERWDRQLTYIITSTAPIQSSLVLDSNFNNDHNDMGN